MKNKINISLSNRHIHLCRKDADILFGNGYEFKVRNELSQPGQYACDETVTISGPKGAIDRVRILGPLRSETQVEVLTSDCYKLGIQPVYRVSGDLKGSAALTVTGPCGSIELAEGVIVALRHIHMNPSQAEEYGLKDKDIVSVKVPGDRGLVFDNVLVRVTESGNTDFHVDTEEGNAAGAYNSLECIIIRSL
ncbi:MAG: phosphate propanoyltransferase [Eubacteriaceae bacterium]|nr:phosphate propanoyltransferase [Eubacteriaceae bacterium]